MHILFFLFFLFSATLQANMLKDMAFMVGAQIGASEANQDIAQEFFDITNTIQLEQSMLNRATKNFFDIISDAKNIQTNTIFNIFSKAQTQLNTIASQQQTQIQDIQSYLQSVTSLQRPALNYLDNPIVYDQLFTNGTMYTPAGHLWKNIFQVGDWEFDGDQNTQSFWQYQAVPFISKTNLINDTFKNFIFTEWSPSGPYEIICDIKLYKVLYPFYVGIIFNKARWISGDTYGLQKYRTLGIYADSAQKISLCFAQQEIPVSTAKGSSTPKPITPLEKIYTNQADQNFAINQTAFTNLETAPITFHVKIKPSINSVSYKIWSDASAEPAAYTTIQTNASNATNNKIMTIKEASGNSVSYLSSNHNDLYLYHGIGFLSAGAIAQFIIKGPQDILFTPSNIDTFNNEISNYFKEQQHQFQSQQLLNATAQGTKNV